MTKIIICECVLLPQTSATLGRLCTMTQVPLCKMTQHYELFPLREEFSEETEVVHHHTSSLCPLPFRRAILETLSLCSPTKPCPVLSTLCKQGGSGAAGAAVTRSKRRAVFLHILSQLCLLRQHSESPRWCWREGSSLDLQTQSGLGGKEAFNAPQGCANS